MTTKYKCGHEMGGVIILDDNIFSLNEYIKWSETVGLKGTKKMCFDCYLAAREKFFEGVFPE